MALDFAKDLCQPRVRYNADRPILSAASAPEGAGTMSCDAILQEATLCSTQQIENDANGLRFPVMTPAAVASSARDDGSTEGEAERGLNSASTRITCYDQAGLIEIHDPRLLRPGYEVFCRALVRTAVACFEASRAEVHMESSTCRLKFEPGRFDRTELARRVAESVRAATPAVRGGPTKRHDAGPAWTTLTAFATDGGTMLAGTREDLPGASASAERPVATPMDLGRLVELALARGSFALAIGGFIPPGIPTLPFLIVAGRFAVRASPGIQRLLMRPPRCAVPLAKVETPSGSSLD
jgi:hypothetical protein